MTKLATLSYLRPPPLDIRLDLYVRARAPTWGVEGEG
jgi:hypothetical protein